MDEEAIPRKEAETAAADHAATLYGAMLQGVSMLRK
jgi:hypothetical protein